MKGAFWVWGSNGVLRVRIAEEDRNVWKLHLEVSERNADGAFKLALTAPSVMRRPQTLKMHYRTVHQLTALRVR